MKTLVTLALAATMATPSFAWGDREQGALLGLVIGSTIANIHNKQQQPGLVVPSPPPQAIYVPAPQVIYGSQIPGPRTAMICKQEPLYDTNGVVITAQTVCRPY
jgi:hypothetical protein